MPSRRDTTSSATCTDPEAGGRSTGIPPAARTASAYCACSTSAVVSHTPNCVRSRYVVRPITGRGAVIGAGSERGDVGTRDAAVDQERVGGDERRVVGGQEKHRAGELLGLTEAAHGHVDESACGTLGVLG